MSKTLSSKHGLIEAIAAQTEKARKDRLTLIKCVQQGVKKAVSGRDIRAEIQDDALKLTGLCDATIRFERTEHIGKYRILIRNFDTMPEDTQRRSVITILGKALKVKLQGKEIFPPQLAEDIKAQLNNGGETASAIFSCDDEKILHMQAALGMTSRRGQAALQALKS